MNFSLPMLGTLVRDSLTRPRQTIRTVLDLRLPPALLWEVLVLVAVLGDLLVWGGLALTSPGRSVLTAPGMPGPLFMAALQLVLMIGAIYAIDRVGRLFGGTGDFAGALAVMVWLQVVMLALQLGQFVLYLIAPPVADLLGIALFAVMFWLISNFIAELHGFRSLVAVLLGVILGIVGLVVALSFVLFALGVVVSGNA